MKFNIFQFYFFLLPTVLIVFLGISIYMSQPPQSIVIEAGPKAGFFASTANFLKSSLKKYDIDATVIYKHDTTNIISRVNDVSSGSHIGFSAQDLGDQELKNLHSLGAVILEPLLFFTRSDSNINNLSESSPKYFLCFFIPWLIAPFALPNDRELIGIVLLAIIGMGFLTRQKLSFFSLLTIGLCTIMLVFQRYAYAAFVPIILLLLLYNFLN